MEIKSKIELDTPQFEKSNLRLNRDSKNIKGSADGIGLLMEGSKFDQLLTVSKSQQKPLSSPPQPAETTAKPVGRQDYSTKENQAKPSQTRNTKDTQEASSESSSSQPQESDETSEVSSNDVGQQSEEAREENVEDGPQQQEAEELVGNMGEVLESDVESDTALTLEIETELQESQVPTEQMVETQIEQDAETDEAAQPSLDVDRLSDNAQVVAKSELNPGQQISNDELRVRKDRVVQSQGEQVASDKQTLDARSITGAEDVGADEDSTSSSNPREFQANKARLLGQNEDKLTQEPTASTKFKEITEQLKGVSEGPKANGPYALSSIESSLSVQQRVSKTSMTGPYPLRYDKPFESSAQWTRGVFDRVNWLVQNKIQSAQIRIDPEELGPVKIEVKIHKEHASVLFTSHSNQVREVLENNVARVKELLQEQGFADVQADVRQEKGDSGEHNEGSLSGSSTRNEAQEDPETVKQINANDEEAPLISLVNYYI